MPTLSVIIITLNEEKNIGACLDSVRWADERVVIDTGSTDRTAEIAKGHGALVDSLPWEGYGVMKSRALERARSDWILSVDADERVPVDLAVEIRKVVSDEDRYNGYTIPRLAYFLGKPIRHGGWYPAPVLRLFRRGSGRFVERRIHERAEVPGPVGALSNDLIHHAYPDLTSYFEKFNRYTELSALQMCDEGRRRAVLPYLLFDPPFTFFWMYIVQRGFLDGMRGFFLSVSSAVFSFVKYAKLWEKREQLRIEN